MGRPRRSWQRRSLQRCRDSDMPSDKSKENKKQQILKIKHRGQHNEADFNSSSESESNEECRQDYSRRRQRAIGTKLCKEQRLSDTLSDISNSSSKLDSSSNSGIDSGYHSLGGGVDEIPDFYDDLLVRFGEEGPILADHGYNTKKMIRVQERKWNKFCKIRKIEPVETLKQCDPALLKVYLVWRVRTSRIKKESTAVTYWKVLSLLYSQKTASWMKEDVLYDIRNWIHVYLTPTYSLDTSKKEKAGIFVEDLALLLNHHWIRDKEVFVHERLRIQLAAHLILAGATATRPGALIGQVLYEHLEFQLFSPLELDERPRLVLKVNLAHIKRSGGKSEPKEFAFREDDMLIYDPLIPIMALAFADNAFINEFKDPEDIYKLKVPSNSDRLRLRWKEEWRKRPVFRDVELSQGIVRVSIVKPLQYSKERRHLIRLGRSIGLAKMLEWYDLRRGSGKKLNEELTPEERNRIMGHRQGDSTVYVQYYMSTFIDADCQSICFGSAPQYDLIHLAGRLLRHSDAPTALTDQQKLEVNQNTDLVRYRRKRTESLQQWKSQGYSTRADAEGTKMAARYDRNKKKVDCLRQKLNANRLQLAIKEFHDSIHIEEIDRQLNGIRPSTVLVPPTIVYELPERATVARLFSDAADLSSRYELNMLRLDLIRALIQLCKRRESPCRRQTARGREPTRFQTATELSKAERNHDSKQPTSAASPFCPFCRWADDEVGNTQREKVWRIDSLTRHIRCQHLKPNCGMFSCPFDGCMEPLDGAQHFANHAAREHHLFLQAAVISR